MTGYVATRWYRAPEIMLNWMHYNQTGNYAYFYAPQDTVYCNVRLLRVFCLQYSTIWCNIDPLDAPSSQCYLALGLFQILEETFMGVME